MKRVCTIGSATQDMFIMYEGTETLHLHQKTGSCTYMLLKQGAKVDIQSIHYATGGGATNVAVGLSRLGQSVEAFFTTGDDPAGRYIREQLAQEKVNTQYCSITREHCTAISIIIPSIEHDQAALCYRAANRTQKKENFPLSLMNDLALIFLGPLGGDSQKLLPYLAPEAKKAGLRVVCNPSLTQLTAPESTFIQALSFIDTLIVNTFESGYLMKALMKETNEPEFIETESSEPELFQPFLVVGERQYTLKDLTQKILHYGPQMIVITNGSEGVYIGTADSLYFHRSIPTYPIFSLGAGDAFSSAFIGGQLRGLSLPEALHLGILNAASVIQHPDAKQGLLTFEELQEKAKTHKNDQVIHQKINNKNHS